MTVNNEERRSGASPLLMGCRRTAYGGDAEQHALTVSHDLRMAQTELSELYRRDGGVAVSERSDLACGRTRLIPLAAGT